MATTDYTNIIAKLETIRANSSSISESGNRRAYQNAWDAVNNSDLSKDEKKKVLTALGEAANPSGWYYTSNGITAAIKTFEIIEANITHATPSNDNIATYPPKTFNNRIEGDTRNPGAFNRRNLKALVSGGKIFSVEFIKRSTGELRQMNCRMGVKRYLKGGSKAYSTKQHNLLTVFDMEAKGYRSIPVEAIQRLSVGGQSFNFAGA